MQNRLPSNLRAVQSHYPSLFHKTAALTARVSMECTQLWVFSSLLKNDPLQHRL